MLVEGGQFLVETGCADQVVGDGMLHRRTHRKRVELVDLAEFVRQRCRCEAVADLPARGVKRLAEGADDEAAFPEFVVTRQAVMRFAIEHDVFVDLVRQQERVRPADDAGEPVEIVTTEYRAGRIVRKVDDQEPGLVGDRVGESVPVHREIEAVIGDCERHVSRDSSGEGDRRFVGVVRGVEDDHLVAGANDRLDCAEQAFGRAGADRYFGIVIDRAALQPRRLVRDGLTQRRNPCHRRVLVRAVCEVEVDAVRQLFRRVEARKSLGEVDRVAVRGELTHHREYRRADVGQLAGNRGPHRAPTMAPPVAGVKLRYPDATRIRTKGVNHESQAFHAVGRGRRGRHGYPGTGADRGRRGRRGSHG